MVALLRGINVGGTRRVPMKELRSLAEADGLAEVETYIQSGNLVFSSSRSAEQVADRLEAGIAKHFGFEVPVVVRSAREWSRALSRCPLAEAAAERPHLVHLCVSRAKAPRGVAEALAPLSVRGEQLVRVGADLWIDFAAGVARSKLTPAALDRAFGATVTARNVKTVRALAELLDRAK